MDLLVMATVDQVDQVGVVQVVVQLEVQVPLVKEMLAVHLLDQLEQEVEVLVLLDLMLLLVLEVMVVMELQIL